MGLKIVHLVIILVILVQVIIIVSLVVETFTGQKAVLLVIAKTDIIPNFLMNNVGRVTILVKHVTQEVLQLIV